MISFLAKRIIQLIPVLLGMSVLVFLLIHFIPGDPTYELLGDSYSEQRAEQLREQLGLDEPLPTQFFHWGGRVLRGDFGRSIFLRVPVAELLMERGRVTATLALLTMLIALGVALPLGIGSAVCRDSWLDNILRVVSVAGISVPVFWVGLILIIVFSLVLGWLPPGGGPSRYGLSAYVLPAAALGLSHAALLMRMTRATVLDTLFQDYIRTAHSKGLRPRTVYFKHSLRNAIGPVLIVAGLQLGSMLNGAVLTESVFSLPGLGTLMIDSVYRRDFPAIQAVVLVTGCAYILSMTLVDVLYVVFDPRIRY